MMKSKYKRVRQCKVWEGQRFLSEKGNSKFLFLNMEVLSNEFSKKLYLNQNQNKA